jgi:hypothetical protein
MVKPLRNKNILIIQILINSKKPIAPYSEKLIFSSLFIYSKLAGITPVS